MSNQAKKNDSQIKDSIERSSKKSSDQSHPVSFDAVQKGNGTSLATKDSNSNKDQQSAVLSKSSSAKNASVNTFSQSENAEDMKAIMGFSSFDSSKGKHSSSNESSEAAMIAYKPKRKYKQFLRPKDRNLKEEGKKKVHL